MVLQDCLRWLALRGLTTPRLFTAPPVALDRKLLALRHLYDTGRRPLRSKSCRDKDPQLVRAGGRGRGCWQLNLACREAARRTTGAVNNAPRALWVRSTTRRARSGCGQQRPSRAASRPARAPPLTPRRASRSPPIVQIANLLLLWLGSLPEPLFPTALIPELVDSQQSDYYSERVSSVRALLKRVSRRCSAVQRCSGPAGVAGALPCRASPSPPCRRASASSVQTRPPPPRAPPPPPPPPARLPVRVQCGRGPVPPV